jgi:hypothetical protein
MSAKQSPRPPSGKPKNASTSTTSHRQIVSAKCTRPKSSASEKHNVETMTGSQGSQVKEMVDSATGPNEGFVECTISRQSIAEINLDAYFPVCNDPNFYNIADLYAHVILHEFYFLPHNRQPISMKLLQRLIRHANNVATKLSIDVNQEKEQRAIRHVTNRKLGLPLSPEGSHFEPPGTDSEPGTDYDDDSDLDDAINDYRELSIEPGSFHLRPNISDLDKQWVNAFYSSARSDHEDPLSVSLDHEYINYAAYFPCHYLVLRLIKIIYTILVYKVNVDIDGMTSLAIAWNKHVNSLHIALNFNEAGTLFAKYVLDSNHLWVDYSLDADHIDIHGLLQKTVQGSNVILGQNQAVIPNYAVLLRLVAGDWKTTKSEAVNNMSLHDQYLVNDNAMYEDFEPGLWREIEDGMFVYMPGTLVGFPINDTFNLEITQQNPMKIVFSVNFEDDPSTVLNKELVAKIIDIVIDILLGKESVYSMSPIKQIYRDFNSFQGLLINSDLKMFCKCTVRDINNRDVPATIVSFREDRFMSWNITIPDNSSHEQHNMVPDANQLYVRISKRRTTDIFNSVRRGGEPQRKEKYKYKGRMYIVFKGIRDGKFIMYKGKRKYI